MATFSDKLTLSKTTVDQAQPVVMEDGSKRQRVLFDTKLPGFGVVVGSKTKTFFAQRGNRRHTIGRYGPYTVDTARTEAKDVLIKLAKGIDPKAEVQRELADGFTVKQGLELLLKTGQTKGRSPRTLTNYRYNIETYLPDWLDRPLASLSRAEVHDRHQEIAADVAAGRYATVTTPKGTRYETPRAPEQGTYTANMAMRIFRAIYNRAMKQHPELPANPCINIDWFPEHRREAAIPRADLPRWFAEVNALENHIRRDYLLLVLFTGLRRESAASMRWEHVDLERGIVHIPRPKGGKAFDLPLSDYLVQMLEARKEENALLFDEVRYTQWVFPAAGSKSGHIAEPWVKLSMPWTVHGLRHTFITVAESLDISLYAIKLLVNHALPRSMDITAGYVTPDVERLRIPMQQITDRLLALCTGKP